MPTPTKGPRLGGGPAHERLMLGNLATSLFLHGQIKTTVTKAKRLQPVAERLITFAKRGDLHARRKVMTIVKDKAAVHVLFTEIAPLLAEREGGYTRITKIGPRKGDNAPMAIIELVTEKVEKQQRATASESTAEPVDDAPSDDTTVEAAATEPTEAAAPGEEAAAEPVSAEAAAEEAAVNADSDGAADDAEATK